jgi:hypothetical protein
LAPVDRCAAREDECGHRQREAEKKKQIAVKTGPNGEDEGGHQCLLGTQRNAVF